MKAIIGTVVDSNEDWSIRIEENCALIFDEATGEIAYKGSEWRFGDLKQK